MSLVIDVYAYADTEQCLEVATGGAMPIYVILEHGGKPHLLVGSVYSYYEFLQPISARLTDEEWRGQWDEGRVPELPAWSGSFVAGGQDVETVIARLRNGEIVSGLEFIQDPALDTYLVENVRSDSPSWDKENVAFVFHAASRRAPDAVNPVLLQMIRNGELRPAGDQSTKNYSPEVASVALRGNTREEDLPELVDIMATSKVPRAELASYPLFDVQAKSLEALLADAVGRCSEPALKFKIASIVHMKASVDITPLLVKRIPFEADAIKIRCLLTLVRIWDCRKRNSCGDGRIASNANAGDLALWETELEGAFADALEAFDWAAFAKAQDALRKQLKALHEDRESKDSPSRLDQHTLLTESQWVSYQTRVLVYLAENIGHQRRENAVPFLRKALEYADGESTEAILSALVNIGTDEAVEILAKSMDSPQMDLVLKKAHDSYMRDYGPETATQGATLIRLLEDTSAFGDGGLRVCDMTLGSLADSFNEDHPGPPLSASLADRDAKLAEWIAHLKSPRLPRDYREEAAAIGSHGEHSGAAALGRRRLLRDEE